jgi:tetratricopeptide (TPR) repeat protein
VPPTTELATPAPPLALHRIQPSMRVRFAAALVLVAATSSAAVLFLAGAFGRGPSRSTASSLASAAALRPDPAAVHYRHPLVTNRAANDELEAGITALTARVTATPASPIDLTELADLHFRRAKLTGNPADYAESERLATRSVEILPSPNGAVLVLAKLANNRHDFARGIELARRHSRGRSPGALTALATAYLALGELTLATNAAEALVMAQPTSAAYLMRALTLQAQGRDDEAAFDFTRAALAEEEGDVQEAARLRALWARFLLRRGELRGTADLLAEALRIAPGHPLALAQKGELMLRTGEPKKAAALFEQAFASSRQVRYLMDQARAQALLGDLAGADALRAQVEKLVRAELGEGGLGHRLDLIEVLVDRSLARDAGSQDPALAEAIALAREELAHRASAETRYQLARALAAAGNDAGAMEQVQTALAAGTREPQLYELAARLEVRRHNTARAALYGRLARQLDPAGSGWRQAGLASAR